MRKAETVSAKEVADCIAQVELQEALREDDYLRHWNAVDDHSEGGGGAAKINKEVSLGYARVAKLRKSAGQEHVYKTLRRVKQCKAGTLLTGKSTTCKTPHTAGYA